MDLKWSYEPYEIQKEMSDDIYNCLKGKKIGILESPTGTGKSLSIIMGIYKFFLEYKLKHDYTFIKDNDISISNTNNSLMPDWFNNFNENDNLINDHINCKNIELKNLDIDFKKKFKIDDNILEYLNKKYSNLKIIYMSRTHSQISEFIKEIKKTSFKNLLKIIHLGSRTKLCCNKKFNKNKNEKYINDLCKLNRKKCEYYKLDEIINNKNNIFENIHDIEDIYKKFENHSNCPYYSAKYSSKFAEIICIPYCIILNKMQRDQYGLDLENSILIFDEAHNVSSNIYMNNTHEISFKEIIVVLNNLKLYNNKYESKKNENIINILKNVINTLKNEKSQNFKIIDFIVLISLSSYDIFEISNYINDIKLSQKIKFFSFKNNNEENESLSSNLDKVFDFFVELISNYNNEYKIILKKTDNNIFLKLFPLNIQNLYKEILDNSLAAIFTGGTLTPFDKLKNELKLVKKEIYINSYNHIVDSKNFELLVVEKFENFKFNFSFKSENQPEQFSKIKNFINEISHLFLKKGIIIFVPSYRLLNSLKNIFIKMNVDCFFDDGNINIINKFENNLKHKTTILISVMGGKLSEGINFKDDLARLLILIGIPYPNIKDEELKCKLDYLFKDQPEKNKREYLMNITMNNLNQCIGRAIRHKNDYASIIVFDQRYNNPSFLDKFPKWIKPKINIINNKENIKEKLRLFFKNR